ncbi:putative monovalent cation/H+ antiporter subunit A [Kallotenue papyrolyticum]|uniref:putative monovalent cation/H+ antiporter subunit A n=1 Tax=Kallotenue papyrolyticum TaxID=1325125 RepID=UPI000492E6E4|nr:putative monovalent cation/H+ antiporter subunit A [Kallotenue papyrolyticum]
MLLAVMSGFGLALGAPWLHRLSRAWSGWLLALLPAGLLLYFAGYLPTVARGEAVRVAYGWVAGLNLNLAFRLDGLSLLLTLLVLGIGALILIYGGSYLAADAHLGRFYAFLTLFMASMLGLVLADNILVLFIFWELTSISSYLLIGYKHTSETARAAALQALLVTGAGGLALLGGLVLLGLIGGAWEFSALSSQRAIVLAHPLYLPTLLLILLGALTKSAQAPFHFWLPAAMEAPTPVSAYLHSATMVKAGVYLLARLQPILSGSQAWSVIVSTVGAVSLLLGGALALRQHDLKRMLAYSTISALGMLTLLLGLGSAYATTAMAVFLLAHALYKGALFMVVGVIDHATGTRDVDRLGGLRRAMPLTALCATLAAIALAGFGPVLSFIAKELLLEAVLHLSGGGIVLVPVVVLGSASFVAVAAILAIRPFHGAPTPTPRHPHEGAASMLLGPALLATLGLILGLAPGLVANTLIAPVVSATMGRAEAVELKLWHGLTPAFGLSLLSVMIGLGVYLRWIRLRRAMRWLDVLFGWGPTRWYAHALHALNVLARWQTGLLQNGRLPSYLRLIIVTTIALVGYTLLTRVAWPATLPWSAPHFYELMLAILILLAAVSAVLAPSRLSAVATLSIVGSGIALIYIFYSAPDLAMTQILVETLTVLLFVLVFYHLPRFNTHTPARHHLRDGVIALGLGSLITALVLAVSATPPQSAVAPYYIEHSKPLAHGRNIVNVILVDFRGLDTLGEITVLAVAAVGVVALLRLRPWDGKSK